MKHKNYERTRNFSLVTYLPHNVIENILNNARIERYAYITHDKDINEDNTLKAEHTHVIIVYRDARTLSAVVKEFSSYKLEYCCNTLVEPIINLRSALRYLVHADNKDKFQYSSTLVKSTFPNFLDFVVESEDCKTLNLLDDIISEVPLREMVKRYGRDVVLNYNKYTSFAHMLFAEEHNLSPIPSSEDLSVINERIVIKKWRYKNDY